jgi:hypothetical protein
MEGADVMVTPAAPSPGSPPALRHLTATRYVTALREGGSVPAVVEADDGGLWVAKFRGSAQGGRALAAEVIVGELARAAGLPMPELALIDVDAAIGRSEPHQEIRELLVGSAGLNLAMAYLPGALGYDVAAKRPVGGALASAIVALDVFAVNVDRTAKNPNLLWWKGDLWLIDHGAALYWHHGWAGSADEVGDALAAAAARPFARAAEHVLLPFADRLPEAASAFAAAIDDAVIARAVAAVPAAWLAPAGAEGAEAADPAGGDALRAAYVVWLRARRAALPRIIEEANRVRATRV